MTEHELRRRFPNASASTIKRNKTGGAASSPKPEQVILDEPVAEKAGETKDSAPIHVSIRSYRRRLLDPDNACPKYFIDCLRYSGLIPDDRPEDITLQVSQVKVKTKAEERTEITIEPI